jgi:Peptidase A4 family
VRIERKIGASVVVLGSLLLALSSAAPALAHSDHAAGFSHVTGLKFAGTANTASTGFAGWEFGASPAKSVTAEFKVPALKCTKTLAGTFPMAAMLTGSTGSLMSAAGLVIGCQSGSPAAAPAVMLNNSQTDDPNTKDQVAVGDLMKGTVTISASKVTATISDLTKGRTFTFTKSATGGTAVAEAIIDDSLVNTSTNKQLPVVNFGKISFSAGAVSGKAIGSVKPQAAINMQTAKGVLQILTGKITGSGKNAFTTTWKHS